MAQYHMVVFSKEAHSWAFIDAITFVGRAQANLHELKRDVIKQCTEYFDDNETMDDEAVNRASVVIEREIDEIDLMESIRSDVEATLRRLLDEDIIDIDSLDIEEFIEVSLDVSRRGLIDEINDNKEEMELSFTVILNAVGVIVYEVHDPDDVLVGKVVLNWLEG